MSTIGEALLAAVRRRSIAREKLHLARELLLDAEIELRDANREVNVAEQAEREETPL